ncbi:hypothetical protein L211DRAFT_604082 [Terfezia boudieri ATCC MYA-4762]|uniref:Uncharacterized protein n=1 Tax=Terfezia boudieri ATCC MYA-4762 TaxID=1051890 RepID=A0A3N4LVV7_9PEZI|nr:hypothetical protein L211DRAFT_604082 [Terfezia boudieri ATCC MYA-4762]
MYIQVPNDNQSAVRASISIGPLIFFFIHPTLTAPHSVPLKLTRFPNFKRFMYRVPRKGILTYARYLIPILHRHMCST